MRFPEKKRKENLEKEKETENKKQKTWALGTALTDYKC